MKKFKAIKICRTIVQILFFIFLPSLISLAFFQVKALFIDLINFNYSQIVSDCIVIILLSILTMLAGRIFSILSKCKIFKINKEKTVCGNCKACSAKCSMGIDLDSVEKVNSGECIQCLNCVGICPKENARMKFLNKDIDEKSFFTIVISLFVGTYALTNSLITYNLQNNSNLNNLSTEVNQNNNNTNTNINSGKSSNTNVSKNTNTNTNFNTNKNTNTNNSTSTNTNKSTNTNSNTNTSATSSTKYKDGTYTGVGRGYRDGLTVSVTIKNNKITNIEIVSINDTPGYYEKATNVVPKEIINSQSTKVNTVSGATRSSNGIISAVNDALSEALI